MAKLLERTMLKKIFNQLKKLAEPCEADKELAGRYGLEYRTSSFSTISGSAFPKAWEGEYKGLPLSFRHIGYLEVVLGEMLPAVDYVLEKARDRSQAAELEPPYQLDRFITTDSTLVREWFFKLPPYEGDSPLDMSHISNPDFHKWISRFPPEIKELGIYRWGLEFKLPNNPVDSFLLDRSLSAALPMVEYLYEFNKESRRKIEELRIILHKGSIFYFEEDS